MNEFSDELTPEERKSLGIVTYNKQDYVVPKYLITSSGKRLRDETGSFVVHHW